MREGLIGNTLAQSHNWQICHYTPTIHYSSIHLNEYRSLKCFREYIGKFIICVLTILLLVVRLLLVLLSSAILVECVLFFGGIHGYMHQSHCTVIITIHR